MVTGARTELVPGPAGGRIETLTTGRAGAAPSSIFAHGLAGSIPTTRPYAARVAGTRTFLHFRGHGRSTAQARDWSYGALAADVWAVADHVGATGALGVSMGAGALCAGLVQDPDRFDRVVLVLPAVLDRPRDDAAMRRFGALGRLVEAGDVEAVGAHLLSEQPDVVRADPGVRTWCRQQAQRLVTSDVAQALAAVPHEVPLADRSALAAVSAEVLVLAQEDDPAHPVAAAEELAEALTSADLHVLPPGGIMWAHRDRVRDLVGDFLSARPAR
ncbi:alpha/beta fold hydrolase [Ornithinimicrobium sediminis]|uniref:alpha/beta fold hydrolase n=1 Tax=Ornithinimicrobium sediminis TaxID=2904603 RepID=UPI001E2B2B30|nr:alpha/beta hydrolase [Ornithinimicrobium sediminis]